MMNTYERLMNGRAVVTAASVPGQHKASRYAALGVLDAALLCRNGQKETVVMVPGGIKGPNARRAYVMGFRSSIRAHPARWDGVRKIRFKFVR